MILGIDEAGRGPWAGPLVVGAVVLGGVLIDGLADSKKLTKKRREAVYDQIIASAAAHSSGWVSAAELDQVGMSEALRLATRRAVEQIHVPYSEIIIDGTVNFLKDTGKGRFVQTMAKADQLVPSVSAASVVAKVERDRYMAALEDTFPGYGFKRHAGYGVAMHREAIETLGVISEHRLSFAPLRKYDTVPATLSGASELSAFQKKAKIHYPQDPTTKSLGDTAETIVSEYLRKNGHTILERNWRTKLCEIDIISRKEDTVYFVEVKYRKNDKTGGGFAAITPKKLKQMTFAAELYATRNLSDNDNLLLAAAEVSGIRPVLQTYLELS